MRATCSTSTAEYRLIDWDTACVAAPERDLWDLDPGDGSILEAYSAATGVAMRPEALSLYRLWYDLDEIGGYLEGFRRAPQDDADAAEAWNNLLHFLQPEARWPSLFADRVPPTTSHDGRHKAGQPVKQVRR